MEDILHLYLEKHIQQNKVVNYLEIGTREGDSLKRVVKNNSHITTIIVADMWGSLYGGSGRNSHNHISQLLTSIGYKNSITFLDGDSKTTIPTLFDDYKNFFDLILVDGDHSYDGGMSDLINVFPLCRSNGHILFHDIVHPSHLYLEKCFDEFISKYNDNIVSSIKIKEHLGIGVIIKK
jgi:hypothetical protein